MFVFEAIFLALGGVGLIGATLGCPTIAAGLARVRGFGRRTAEECSDGAALPRVPLKIEIIIPAHDEQIVIVRTLESLEASISALDSREPPAYLFSIRVILDRCGDRTRELVEGFAKSSTVAVALDENPGKAGKWFVLDYAVETSRGADWIAFVDSGSIWDPALAREVVSYLGSKDLLALAPSYMPSNGASDRISWRLEQSLKSLENFAGGPVSVHGASVVYRMSTLVTAWESLRGTHWLNDDVAVPLTLRLGNPGMRIQYLTRPMGRGWVGDIGIQDGMIGEIRRRNRMVFGNLQWVQGLLLPSFTLMSPAVWVGLRRVFRLLWAYWLTCFGIGFVLVQIRKGDYFDSVIWLIFSTSAIAGAALMLLLSSGFRRLASAYLAGLQVPKLWFRLNFQHKNQNSEDVSWN